MMHTERPGRMPKLRGRGSRMVLMALGLALLAGTGCSRARLTVADVAMIPGQPLLIRAYVDREGWLGLRNGVENVPITFAHAGETFVEATTNDDGYCEVLVQTQLDENEPTIDAHCTVEGRRLETSIEALRWSTAQTIIVVDIDGTISDTDYDDLLLDLIDRESQPIADSAETLTELADEFHIVYITARPRYTARKTGAWLETHGYPPGPLYTAPALKEIVDQDDFKRTLLAKLRRAWPSMLIGIGNSDADRKAYLDTELVTLIHSPEAPTSRPAGVRFFSDWASIRAFFDRHREQLRVPNALRQWQATQSATPDEGE